MPDPIVYVDRSEIRQGRLAEVRSAVEELAGFVEANEPQILGYAVYFDPDGSHMNVIHTHRDPASLERHMEVAGPRFAPFASLIRLESIDVYGPVSPAVADALRAKAALLGGAVVRLHPLHAGFVRVPAAAGSVPGT